MSSPAKKMTYGEYLHVKSVNTPLTLFLPTIVRLGNSGLKVSKIILGAMSYGSSEWQNWVLDEEEAIKHIKVA
jgi:hypothetical protein